MRPDASTLVTVGIPAITLLVFAALTLAAARTSRADAGRVALGAGAWLSLSGALAASGFYAQFTAQPARMLLLMPPVFLLPVWLARSSVGERLARETPLWAIVGVQAFRLPLELVMHQAAREGVMPPQMTFTGYNLDILTGITAIPLAALVATGRAPRGLVVAWNALGMALLAAIVGIAVASLPLVHAFGSDAAHLNTWVAYFPFVWLPAGLVASALAGHLVLWRRLRADAARAAP